jgi:transposase
MEKSYATDLTDAEREVLEPHMPTPNEQGRPRIHTLRECERSSTPSSFRERASLRHLSLSALLAEMLTG